MKLSIIALLCAILALESAKAQPVTNQWVDMVQPGEKFLGTVIDETPKAREANKPEWIVVCLFIVACCAGAGYVVWKVHTAVPAVGCKAKFILKRSYDMVNWTNIMTNTFTITNNDWNLLFVEQETDPNAYYRVQLTH